MIGEDPENPDDGEDRFYWSFYELSTGVLISLHHIEYWKDNKTLGYDLECYYANSELKNGELIRYEFSQDFFDWFDSKPPVRDLKELTYVTDEEKKCVKDFYVNHVMNEKDKKTDVIDV